MTNQIDHFEKVNARRDEMLSALGVKEQALTGEIATLQERARELRAQADHLLQDGGNENHRLEAAGLEDRARRLTRDLERVRADMTNVRTFQAPALTGMWQTANANYMKELRDREALPRQILSAHVAKLITSETRQLAQAVVDAEAAANITPDSRDRLAPLLLALPAGPGLDV
jgi:hypothetical protein